MNCWAALIVLATLGIESPEEMPGARETPAQKPHRPVDDPRVEPLLSEPPAPRFPLPESLRVSAGLLRHHLGYLSFLRAHPALERVESEYTNLLALQSFAPLSHAFEEALLSDPEAARLFDDFYDELRVNDALRKAVEGLYRAELDTGRTVGSVSAAVEYLRQHPSTALRFLQEGRFSGAFPEPLRPLIQELSRKPALAQELYQLFQQALSAPAFRRKALPWWQARAALDAESQGAYQNLIQYFVRFPQDFWRWHERNLALAATPHARDWIRYWHGRIRREASFERDYYRYLHHLHAEKAQAKQPTTLWPPAGTPPPLRRLAPPNKNDALQKPTLRGRDTRFPQRPTRPQKPQMRLPEGRSITAPQRPEMRQPK
jgi:hypothetical protein